MSVKRKPNVSDAAVANQLISFATAPKRKAGDDYGICFCSFEYFFEHFKDEVNQPQNAVLFDLNHKLRGVDASLDGRWKAKIGDLKVFEKVQTEINLHGWILHFAMKLGLIDSAECRVGANHVLIVSSALAGTKDASNPASSSMDAFQQYATVQKAMWDALMTH